MTDQEYKELQRDFDKLGFIFMKWISAGKDAKYGIIPVNKESQECGKPQIVTESEALDMLKQLQGKAHFQERSNKE